MITGCAPLGGRGLAAIGLAMELQSTARHASRRRRKTVSTLLAVLAICCVCPVRTEAFLTWLPVMELRVFAGDDIANNGPEATADTLTLREAFERYWLPVNQYLVEDSTAQKYRTALGHWEAFIAERDSSTRTVAPFDPAKPVADVPVSQIGVGLLNAFGVWLMSDGSPQRRPMKQSTVTETAKKIQTILRSIGPRDAKHPHSPALLETVPTMAPARRLAGGKKQETKSGRNLTDEQLGAIYDACSVATWPEAWPVLQWRTFIVATSLIAARAGDSSTLQPSAITLEPEVPIDGHTATHEFGWVRFEADKTEKQHVIPLPPSLSSHVRELLRRRGGQLYQWRNYRQRPFDRQWKAIVAQAGLPDVTRKDLRSTANNRWNAVQDGLGDWLLGHSAKGVNDRHYRDRIPDAIRASIQVAVPAQFNTDQRDGATQTFLF